jgi:hypothetical protein
VLLPVLCTSGAVANTVHNAVTTAVKTVLYCSVQLTAASTSTAARVVVVSQCNAASTAQCKKRRVVCEAAQFVCVRCVVGANRASIIWCAQYNIYMVVTTLQHHLWSNVLPMHAL